MPFHLSILMIHIIQVLYLPIKDYEVMRSIGIREQGIRELEVHVC